MPIEYYLAPVELITLGTRQSTGSRAEVYRNQMADPSLARISNMIPAAGVKAWCATALDAPQEVHDAIAADGTIQRVPTNVLTRTWGELSAAVQNAVLNAMAARRIPSDWITADTTIRQIIGYILRCLDLTVRMAGEGRIYPEADLTQTFGTLPAATRTSIRNFANAHGIANADITTATAIRVVVRRLIESFPFGEFVFLDERFSGAIQAAPQSALDRLASNVLEGLGL